MNSLHRNVLEARSVMRGREGSRDLVKLPRIDRNRNPCSPKVSLLKVAFEKRFPTL